MQHRYLVLTVLLTGLAVADNAINPVDSIQLQTADGQPVLLESDDPNGLITRPLRKLKQRLDRLHHENFLQFRKITVPPGTRITGNFAVPDAALRLTVYHMSRKTVDDTFYLRVISTGYFEPGQVSRLSAVIDEMKNNIFIVTAEKVQSREHLNSHLAYMRSQGNSILLKGYGSNWNLSELKLELSGIKPEIGEDRFTKDADWLVGQLIEPQWVIFIRADKNK